MQRTERPVRELWAQGDADSACFLYCLVNAAFLLNGKQVTGAKWRKAISQMPARADDFLSGVGTGRIGDHPESLQKLSDSFMSALGVSIESEVIHDVSSHNKLSKSVKANQVVILAINNGDHWVTAVDTSRSEIYYACSAQALSGRLPYAEETSPRLGRLYNARATFSDLKVWDSFAILLTRSTEE
ncbi:hypothetical protein SA496_14430 [Pseudomonas sp. JS3066]|uniref:hypothetical protein n=1 Tax=Pseudomonas sp. JS3066 TaxID=3090665 RepID=UPI002E7AE869|nr:hypothetical protein [Pseudomonas sp. JS3066]WVK90942.1 hypothetical protein SA496_14430 [Pseudomonas sp. JS3066]